MNPISEIPIRAFEQFGLSIGQAENAQAGTGCTVLMKKDGMPAGLDVRGGGPASRDSQLLNPLMAANYIHAVVLAGGSAFGLDAAGGVMQYLEEQGYGFDVGVTKVPLVCQSDLFDLTVGDVFTRPDREMALQACINAESFNYQDGNFGAGCGASVGKFLGMDYAMKSGIGSYALSLGDLYVGAVVAVNALGDIFDWQTGQKIAGLLSEDKTAFRSFEDVFYRKIEAVENKFTGNTTIGVVITNAAFTKPQLCKIAGMAHDGYARSIRPVHTTADGDSIYALSVGHVNADQDLVGTLAAQAMSQAITRAVQAAQPAYGLAAYSDFHPHP